MIASIHRGSVHPDDRTPADEFTFHRRERGALVERVEGVSAEFAEEFALIVVHRGNLAAYCGLHTGSCARFRRPMASGCRPVSRNWAAA
ncbi:hypothetical protein ACPXCG_01365 [Gordonia sp. DT218]|uniref:hypothetical protein n=1 Tax=Gordonia sp. DT218 TaxID=3416659 RepID=UPI003CED9201